MNSLKRYRVGRRELPFSVVRRASMQRELSVASRKERLLCDGELEHFMCFECQYCDAWTERYDSDELCSDDYLSDWRPDETLREYEARKRPPLLTFKLWEAA